MKMRSAVGQRGGRKGAPGAAISPPLADVCQDSMSGDVAAVDIGGHLFTVGVPVEWKSLVLYTVENSL